MDRVENQRLTSSAELRCRAEERLKAQATETRLPETKHDMQRLFHELQVCQIELEMQNAELRQGREELEKLLQTYCDLYDFAPVGYLTLDGDGTIGTANLTVVTLLGVERSCLVGQRFELYVSAADRPVFAGFLEKVLANPGNQTCELALLNQGGDSRIVQVVASAIDAGQGCRATIIDITERKLADEKLLKNEGLFCSLMELSPDIVSIIDREGSLVYNSPAALAIHGYTQEEMIGRNTFDLIHPDDQPLCTAYFDRILNNLPGPSSVQYRYRNKDGSYVWMEATATNRTDHPQIPGLIVISRDITQRKQVQEALLLKNLVFDQSIAVNSISDRDGILTEVNQAFVKCWGYESKEEVLGKPIPHFLADPDRAKEIVEALLRSGEWEGEYSARRKDGSLFTAYGLATVVRGENGAIIGFQSSVLDVTARKRFETLLAQAKEAAEAANLAKGRFLANMSHELRTPINGILGMAQLFEYTALSVKQKDYLEAIRNSSENLLALINDVLDLARIESGKLELECAAFSLRGSLSDVIRSQIALAQAKGLSLKTVIPADVPDDLTGDQFRLKQILLNLIGNAIKFTETGEIALSITLEERQANTALLRFDVTDSGIGIQDEDFEKIFTAFSQADASMARRFGGSGLGLAICSQLTELMGGGIGVQSRVGVGSTFRVRLPFAVNISRPVLSDLRNNGSPPVWDGAPQRVLLAEDNDASRMFFIEVLKKYGHSVDIAVNGAEALGKWSQSDYDLILMDVQMPIMDGIEAIGKLREMEKQREGHTGHVPVIALTAHAMADYRADVLSKGFDGYVSKPTRIRDLFSEMKRCLTG